MIKRRFFNLDHRNKDEGFDSSSDDSEDSDSYALIVKEEEYDEAASEERRDEDDDVVARKRYPPASSGYESEDSSGKEIKCYSSGLLMNDDDNVGTNKEILKTPVRENIEGIRKKQPKDTAKVEDSVAAELDKYVLAIKSVFKCRICPRIVCLNEDTLTVHLKSKRHARSKKMLEEGRLKLMLNSDGEIEEDVETHAERHARTIAIAQKAAAPKKNSGRQRQSKRRREKSLAGKLSKADPSATIPAKKKHKVKSQ